MKKKNTQKEKKEENKYEKEISKDKLTALRKYERKYFIRLNGKSSKLEKWLKVCRSKMVLVKPENFN